MVRGNFQGVVLGTRGGGNFDFFLSAGGVGDCEGGVFGSFRVLLHTHPPAPTNFAYVLDLLYTVAV